MIRTMDKIKCRFLMETPFINLSCMETGKNGEGLAQDYFRVIGFDILECNWRHSRYEIDLIISRDRILHIVEVKTRGSEVFGLPETAVTPLKLSRLMKAAARYMATHPKW